MQCKDGRMHAWGEAHAGEPGGMGAGAGVGARGAGEARATQGEVRARGSRWGEVDGPMGGVA